MTVTATVYGKALKQMLGGGFDLDSDTLKVSLHTASYTPNKDTHEFYTDLTNELSTAGGYTSGGQALTSKVLAYDTTNDRATLDCDDPSWATATFTCRYAVVRKDTGVSATSPLLGWIDFGANQSPAAATFTLQLDATGLLRAA